MVDFMQSIFETVGFDASDQGAVDLILGRVATQYGLAEADRVAVAAVAVKIEPGLTQAVRPSVKLLTGRLCTTVARISEFCHEDADEGSKVFMRSIKNISHIKLLAQFLTCIIYEWAFVDLEVHAYKCLVCCWFRESRRVTSTHSWFTSPL